MVHGSWYQPVLKNRGSLIWWKQWLAPENCVSFSGTCLAIRHDDTVEAIKDILNNRFRHLLVSLSLSCFRHQYMIKEKVPLIIVRSIQRNLLARNLINVEAV